MPLNTTLASNGGVKLGHGYRGESRPLLPYKKHHHKEYLHVHENDGNDGRTTCKTKHCTSSSITGGCRMQDAGFRIQDSHLGATND